MLADRTKDKAGEVKKIPASHLPVWTIPALALIIAILPLPYSYYWFLRIVVCVAASFLAWREYELGDGVMNLSLWGMVTVAVIFNPVFPVYLFKSAWVIINIITAGAFLVHLRYRGAMLLIEHEPDS